MFSSKSLNYSLITVGIEKVKSSFSKISTSKGFISTNIVFQEEFSIIV